jgi:hypothetical protein
MAARIAGSLSETRRNDGVGVRLAAEMGGFFWVCCNCNLQLNDNWGDDAV